VALSLFNTLEYLPCLKKNKPTIIVRPITLIDVPTLILAFILVLRPFCARDVRKITEVIKVVKGVKAGK
jgi:hypothetical protein